MWNLRPRYDFSARVFRGQFKGWAYQDFTSAKSNQISGTSVTLTDNENGTDVNVFESVKIMGSTAVICVLESGVPVAKKPRKSGGLLGVFSDMVTVTAHTGASVTLAAAPASSFDCRIYYGYIYEWGAPLNYEIPSRAIAAGMFTELQDLFLTEEELGNGTKSPTFNVTTTNFLYVDNISAILKATSGFVQAAILDTDYYGPGSAIAAGDMQLPVGDNEKILFNNDGALDGCPYFHYDNDYVYGPAVRCGVDFQFVYPASTAAVEWYFSEPLSGAAPVKLEGQDDGDGDFYGRLYAKTSLYLEVGQDGVIYFDGDFWPYLHETYDIGCNARRVNELFVKTLNVSTALNYLTNNAADTMDVDGDACLTIHSNTNGYTPGDKMLILQIGETPAERFSVTNAGTATATGFKIGTKLLEQNEFNCLDGIDQSVGTGSSVAHAQVTVGTTIYKEAEIRETSDIFKIFPDYDGNVDSYVQFDLVGVVPRVYSTTGLYVQSGAGSLSLRASTGTIDCDDDNVETTGTIEGEQVTSKDDITMAGLLTNILSAADATGILIDGYTNDYTGSGDAIVYGIRNQRDFASTDNDSGVKHYGLFNNISVAHTLDGVVVTATDENYGSFNQVMVDSDLAGTPALHINEENYGIYNYVYKRHSVSGKMEITGTINSYGTKNYVLGDSLELDGVGKTATFNSYGTYSQVNMSGTETNGTLNMNNYGDYIDVTGGAGGTSTNYGIYIAQVTGADTQYAFYEASGEDTYLVGDISANDVTDRTPAFWGTSTQALAAIAAIKNKGTEIDHNSLPAFAQRTFTEQRPTGELDLQGRKITESVEVPARSLGAMVTLLAESTKELEARIKVLERAA